MGDESWGRLTAASNEREGCTGALGPLFGVHCLGLLLGMPHLGPTSSLRCWHCDSHWGDGANPPGGKWSV